MNRFVHPDAPQAAAHYLVNLVPLPEVISIAPRYLGGYPVERVQSGLTAFHSLMAAIYRAGVETPELLVPPATARRQKGLKEADFTAYPRLLFALGIHGKPVESQGQAALWVESSDLADFCNRAHIRDYESFLAALAKFGLFHMSAQQVQLGFPSSPNFFPALLVFAKACRPLTNRDINPPVEFWRADVRLLQIDRKKVRQVPLDPEEAIRALVDEKEAVFVRELDAWARSAGYSALVRCAGVHKSEFNAIYRHPKVGHTLFGFRTEFGRLHMHLCFNQMIRILPYIAQTPFSFRELYYERCACAECGGCQSGPAEIELDGAVHRLCHFSYMNLPEVPAEHFNAIQFLLKAQDSILNEINGVSNGS